MSEYMNEDMFGRKDMIFNHQSGGGIQSGGLSIRSMMISKGMSPIMSINTDKDTKDVQRVSELFENLVIPLGLINGIKNINSGYNINDDDDKYIYDDECYEDKDDEIDSLYDKLLKLVEPDEKEIRSNNNEILLLGGKKKNKSKKNRALNSQSKINGVTKSKKNMKIKINN
jgi:hypothetical protein